MLVLSRKLGESIVIDEDIVVTVIEVRGNRVRLGIQAPGEMHIHRSEVWAAIQEEQKTDTDRLQPAQQKASA